MSLHISKLPLEDDSMKKRPRRPFHLLDYNLIFGNSKLLELNINQKHYMLFSTICHTKSSKTVLPFMHHANDFSSHNVPRWEGVFRSRLNYKQGLETIFLLCLIMVIKLLFLQTNPENNLVKWFLKWSLITAHCPDNLRQCALTRQRYWKKYWKAFSQLTTYDLDP